ncbi:MAG: hypothetical protein ACOYK0_02340 [Candidatus Nanopelagicaceae bacterium]
MQRRPNFAIIGLISAALTVAHLSPAQAVVSNSLDLNACVTAINDPQYTRDTIATTIRNPNGTQKYADGNALQAAITAGSIYLYVANGSGLIFDGGGARQNAPDLYCGDSNDNTVNNLDSDTASRDTFFGGAGNDTVTNSWLSDFYGGPGNDYVGSLAEDSYFNGGPGTDSVGTNSSSTFVQGLDDVTPPTITSSATFSAAENQTAIGTATANEAVTWSILSGVDSATVNLVSGTGVLTFKSAPNFEAPTDTGANNVYNLTIRATDTAGNTTNQAIAITVTDVIETSSFSIFRLAGSVTTATYRTAIVITAEVNVSAKVTFKVNGVVIPSCKNKSASGSGSSYIATCAWRASRRGALSLTAVAVPTSAGIGSSNPTPINVWVSNRSGSNR